MKIASWPTAAVLTMLAISIGSASAQEVVYGRGGGGGGETPAIGNADGGGGTPNNGIAPVEYTGSVSNSGDGGSAPTPAPPGRVTIRTEQGDALGAVKSFQALPLETILGTVRDVTKGKVIDAGLTKVQGFLLYEVRVLENDGTVKQLYYYAKSGLPVGSD